MSGYQKCRYIAENKLQNGSIEAAISAALAEPYGNR
jgi:hypothetical protein